ncbi:MAG: WS/DGAT domain-containing protein, partial [Candidatus Rokuibacteriota bacterium]
LQVPLDDLKAAGKASGGTVNDAFVAGVCGGLRLYHERHGAPVEELRMTMPINIRSDTTEDVAGNQFVPARFTVPVSLRDPIQRMREIHRRAGTQRREPGIALVEEVAGVLGRFPTALSVWLFGSMLKRIDFVTSNVPGPAFEIFASGARVDETYGFGPLAGAAINVTLFSYNGSAFIAVNSDRGAVPDPEVLRECLQAGLEEVIAVGKPAARQEAAAGG